jgi:hypothetical protein
MPVYVQFTFRLPPLLMSVQTQTFNQQVASSNSSNAGADPHAAAFLRQVLGPEKWNIFSARLFERRLSQSKSGATVIDFLVKVEVVKEILRTYVP